jgi:non-specific serine/threonine protein kinase
LRLVSALGGFWYAHGHYREGTTWIEHALATAPRTFTHERAPVLAALARLRWLQGDFTSADGLLIQSVAALRNGSDVATLALALIVQGANAISLGNDTEAEAVLDEALGVAKTTDDPAIGGALAARTLANLGLAAHARGDLDLAVTRHHLALRTAQEHAYVLGVIRSLRDLGDVARDQGDYATSVGFYQESLALWGERGDVRVLIDILEGTALATAAWNEPERAARLLGAAEAFSEQFGTSARVQSDQAAHDRAVTAVRVGLAGPRVAAAWSAGRLMTIPEAITEVRALVQSPASGQIIDRSGIRLMPREREILRMLAAGRSDREIAAALFLSARTVEGHVARIRTKLGVRTRAAAVAAAMAAGIVDSSSLE